MFDSSRLDRRSAAVVSLPAAIGHDCTDSRSSPVGESEKPHATMELSINRCTEIPLPSITLKFYNFGAVDRGWRSARPGFPARVTAHSEWPTNSDAAVASSARRSMVAKRRSLAVGVRFEDRSALRPWQSFLSLPRCICHGPPFSGSSQVPQPTRGPAYRESRAARPQSPAASSAPTCTFQRFA